MKRVYERINRRGQSLRFQRWVARKRCLSCKHVKPRSHFYPNPRLVDGLETVCKQCRGEIHRHRRQQFAAHYRTVDAAKRRTVEYKEYHRRYMVAYREKNK